MAQPFGDDFVNKSKGQFNYMPDLGDDSEVASTGIGNFRLVVRREEFHVDKREETPHATSTREGKVNWRWLDMTTFGDCACWGVVWEERAHMIVVPTTLRLYEMTPHNIDSARQSLSLMLGLGALVHYAAKYEGREDIFADAEWDLPSVYDKQV